jgi:hypothetical protein
MKRSRLALTLSITASPLVLAGFTHWAWSSWRSPHPHEVAAPALANESAQAATLARPKPQSRDAAQQSLQQAKQLGWQAAVLAQNPPHPADTWQEARVNWRQAIRLLEKIPADAPIFAEVQQRLQTYQENYQAIDARLTSERGAVEAFNTAQDLAWQAAVTVQTPPHSLKVWQRADRRWREAIALLETIPPRTTVSTQAAAKAIAYRQNLAAIQQRLQTQIQMDALLNRTLALSARLEQVQLSAMSGQSTDPVGIHYEDYRRQVKTLRQDFNQLAERPGIRQHPLYAKLATVTSDYEFALQIWDDYQAYKKANAVWLHNQDFFNQLIPLAQVDSETLLNRYSSVKVYPGIERPKISLKFTLWEIWETAEHRLDDVQT